MTPFTVFNFQENTHILHVLTLCTIIRQNTYFSDDKLRGKQKSSYIWVSGVTANRMILKSFSTFWYRDAQISQKSNSYPDILSSSTVTWSKFHTKYPQILCATKQNLVGWVTWTWDLCTCTSNTIKFQTAPDSWKHFNCSSSQRHKPSWERKQQASKHGF
jgi:hypothetical protein